MLKETQREWYSEHIRATLDKSYQGNQAEFSPLVQRRIDEVIEALALGCTLARPRAFRGRYMEAKDFRRIADKMDGNIMAVAVDAWPTKETPGDKSRWDLRGVLARF